MEGGRGGGLCDIVTHRGQVGSQGKAAAAWGKASDWSPAARSAPAAHQWPGSSLMLHLAWKGCNSNNDVRSLLLH